MSKTGKTIVAFVLLLFFSWLAFSINLPAQDTTINTTFSFNVEFESLTDGGDTTFAVKIDKARAVKIIDNQFTYGSKSRYLTFKLPDLSDLMSEMDTIGMYTDTAVYTVINNDRIKGYLERVQSLVEADSVRSVDAD